ncbi:unnamed protein product [Linum trigynum]|uniref:Uncharacterized protein n=1 Tax=Linum trigynum TaxID=586398 RepID=A0AAV2CDT9_9ROSI
MVTGKQVAAYTGYENILRLSFRTKKWAAQKETSMEAMERKSDVKPQISFRGSDLAKSLWSKREVRMVRKVTSDVTDKQRATNDVMAKTLKAGSCSRTGVPVSSLLPPGTVDDPANATVATSAATTEHDSLVLFQAHWC